MKRLSFFFSAIMVMGVALSSCKKSNNYNVSPGGQATMAYQVVLTNSGSAKITPGGTTTAIQWTSGFANPDVITFQATQNDLQVTYRSTNPNQIDLMAPVAVAFGNFSLPAGTYDKIKLKIDVDKTGANPAMQIMGVLNDGSISLPVTISITNSVDLQTEEKNVTITNDSSYVAVTTIDMSTVIAGISTSMLLDAQLSGGTIYISATSNKDLYHIVLENLEKHQHRCHFEHHHHGD